MALPITCVVADDHPPVVDAVVRWLERQGFRVVGRARDGEEAIAHVEAQRPDVALIDLRMPGLGGAAVVRRLARSTPQSAPLVYSGLTDHASLLEALDAGARGYVLKEAPLSALAHAIQTVAAGRRYIDPGFTDALIRAEPQEHALTAAERDILRLLADGHSNETIGKELLISPDTARTKLGLAMAKLDAGTRTAAVATALRRALIS